MTTSSLSPARFTWRQCVWLCLPALVVGAVLRIWLLVAIPEGFFAADSHSYFETASRLWTKHQIKVSDKRRWLYPLALAATPQVPPSPARVIPVAQHGLGLLTILGAGWIVGNLTRLRKIWVPLVTLLYAVWPRILWYEHEIVAESVFLSSFVLMAALAFPVGSLKEPRRLLWFLLAAALVVAVKPHGRGIWLAALLSAVLIAGNPLKWGWKCGGAVALGVLTIITSGRFSQASWLLLSSALPLVPLEGENDRLYREALRPLIIEARGEGLGYAWTQEVSKKRLCSRDPAEVAPLWAELTLPQHKVQFGKICSSLAREGILSHPLGFAGLTATKCLIALSDEAAKDNFAPPRFWEAQAKVSSGRWAEEPAEMELLYRMDATKYQAMTAERQTRTYPVKPFHDWVARTFTWVDGGFDARTRAFFLKPRPLGVLALLGFACGLWPGRFAATSVLWLPVIFYLATVFAVGDRLPRYVQPVEWVGWILAALALDVLCGSAARLFPMKKPVASMGAAVV